MQWKIDSLKEQYNPERDVGVDFNYIDMKLLDLIDTLYNKLAKQSSDIRKLEYALLELQGGVASVKKPLNYDAALRYLQKWIDQDQTGITKSQIITSVSNQCAEALEGAE